jgi:hypothetical protein
MNFVHHVLFWAVDPENAATIDQLCSALASLRDLPMIQQVHIGRPVTTDFDKDFTETSYTVSLVLVFENAEKEHEYLHHERSAYI